METLTRPRRQPAVDYLLLKDGYEERSRCRMSRSPLAHRSTIESSLELGPEDYISHIASQPLSRSQEVDIVSPVLTL
ncbi:hypothetical protein V1521DRAFT_119936 [Lipomyces starkeyi]